MCVFAAFWQGATTQQIALCQEEQRRQGAAKACNHTRSALTEKVNAKNANIHNHFKRLLITISGQLRILGSRIASRHGDHATQQTVSKNASWRRCQAIFVPNVAPTLIPGLIRLRERGTFCSPLHIWRGVGVRWALCEFYV